MWNENQFGLSDNERIKRELERVNEISGGSYQAKVSGDYGEFKMSSILKGLPSYYHVMDNILLDTTKKIRGTDGKMHRSNRETSTQIDHIIVSPFGVFVIETKNHKGMIFGDYFGTVWTQVLKNGMHNTFYNPVRQNMGHIENLSKSIQLGMQYIKGIIVFTNAESNRINVRCDFCVTPEQLWDYMRQFRIPIFTERQVEAVIKRIDKVNKSSYINDKKHIQFVKAQKERYEYYRDRKKGIIK